MAAEEYRVLIPEEVYTLVQFTDNELPGVGVINSSLVEFEPKGEGGMNLSGHAICSPYQPTFYQYLALGAGMDIPDSMKEELGRWNDGAGIDLESWVSCMGNYSLAVGYLTIFWPEFVEYDGYILRKGFSEKSLKGFERQAGANRKSVEWVMNHLHISDIHCGDGEDLTQDKIVILGRTLKEIYEAKLARQFPNSPCIVYFSEPDDKGNIDDYEFSFWQAPHENTGV